MEERKYTLKNPGERIKMRYGQVYNASNITDEVAEKLINRNPNYLKKFNVRNPKPIIEPDKKKAKPVKQAKKITEEQKKESLNTKEDE